MKAPLKLGLLILSLSAFSAFTGCAGSSNSSTTPVTTPAPSVTLTVTSVAPNVVSAGVSALTLTVSGSGFTGTTVIQVSGTSVPTTLVSSTQVTAVVPTAQLASGAMLSVVAVDGTSTSGIASPISLEVDNPSPAITQLSPSTFVAGVASTIVTVNGTGFVPSTVVQVGGSARSTAYISATQVSVTLTASDLSKAGTLSLVATNSTPKGGSSAAASVSVSAPPASLAVTSISPAVITAGSGALNLTVNGAGFNSTTAIQVGTTVAPTTFVNSTQVTAIVPAGQLANGSFLPVVAINSTGTSAAGASLSLEVDNPVPAIMQITPSTLSTGLPSTTVAVTGSGFVPGTAIQVGGNPRSTSFSSSTQVNVILTASDLAASGNVSLIAVNLAPKGGSSAAASVAIQNPVPGALTLSPSTVSTGATTPTTVTVTGSNFIAASTVQIGTSPRTTTYVSNTQLTFQLTVADQATATRLFITVVNPSPAGGTSTSAALTVAAPSLTPVITSVTPTSIIAGSTSTIIQVLGSNLNTTSVVQWNGTNLATTTVSGSQFYLLATVPANLLTSPGTASVTVINPTATPTTSNALSVTIANPPAPTLTSISPNYGPFNTATPIALYGTGFTAASTVTYNGVSLAATFVSSGQLTVTLPASSIAIPGTGSFAVTTPAPGGGTSGAQAFSAYIPIVNNSAVFNQTTGLFYLSIPGSAGAPYGNSIVSVDPATGAFGTPIYVGSEPNKMALTADGQSLWVGLDGSSAVRKVNLSAGTAGLQFSLKNSNSGIYNAPPVAISLAALPGATDSVIVYSSVSTFGSTGLSIYDSGVLRTGTGSTISVAAYALLTDGSRSEIYAGGSGLATLTYSSSGLANKASNGNTTLASSSYDEMQLLSGKLFNDLGKVYDAESGSLLGTLYQSGTTIVQGATYADGTLGKIFVADNSGGYYYSGVNQIQIFNLSDYTSAANVIPVNVPYSVTIGGTSYYSNNPTRLSRWGANGLAFRVGYGIYSVQSNLVKDLSGVSADLGVTMATSGSTVTGGTSIFTATVTNQGPAAATDVVVSLQPPAIGSVFSASASVGSCTSGGTISCNLGSLASAANATITLNVLQTVSGTSTVSAQVGGSANDPVISNNTASATATITGNAYNPTPTVSTISPSTVQVGANDTTITVNGTGFTSSSSVLFGGSSLTTKYVSQTQLTATVPSAMLTTLGWGAISISNPTPGGGVSGSVPLSIYSVITLGLNRILYDPYSRKIMGSVGSGSSSVTGNSIVAITPETASVGTPVSIGSQPTKMALTSDGQILYTILAGATSVARYNMLTAAADFTAPIGSPGMFYTTNLRDVAAQPGTEDTVALDLGSSAGSGIYDFSPSAKTATLRGSTSSYYTGSCLQFLDASNLYSFDIDTTGASLYHYVIGSSGIVSGSTTNSTLNRFGCFKINGGLAFANGGGVANPATNPATQVATIPGLTGGTFSNVQALAPDTSLRRAFYPATGGIAAYDLSSYLLSATVPLNTSVIEGATSFTNVDLIRWGQDGLALLTSGGHLYLLRGPVVVPQLLNANSAATLSASSTTTIAHGSGNVLLTLTGSNFIPGVAVTWNGNYRTTTILDATHVTVAIPATDLAAAGTASLLATNPGASASGALSITIN